MLHLFAGLDLHTGLLLLLALAFGAVSTCGDWSTNPGSTVRRGGGSAGLGLATETLASGWWTAPCTPTHLPVPAALDFINEKPTHE